MTRTPAEVEELKRQWAADPCWDLDAAEGFEEHREELAAFAAVMLAGWKAAREDRMSRRAEYFGCPGNLKLAAHLEGLEGRLDALRAEIDALKEGADHMTAEPHRLYDARVMAGLLLSQAARLAGMERRALGDLEWHRATPTDEQLAAFAELYDVRLVWLKGEVHTVAEIIARHGIGPEQLAKLKPDDRAKLLKNLDMTGKD